MVLLFFIQPQNYLLSLVYLLIGCVILGFGVYTEVLANVAMLPGESFVRAVSSTWKTEFGSTKVAFDASLTIIAAILSLLFTHRLNGVREGKQQRNHSESYPKTNYCNRPSIWKRRA